MDLLALGASLSILVTVLVVALAFHSGAVSRTQVRGRLEGVLAGTDSVVEGGSVTPLRDTRTMIGFLRFMATGGWMERIQQDLERADTQLQPIDFISIRIALAGLGFAVPFLFLGGVIGWLVGVAAALAGFQLPQMWINHRQESRMRKLEEQLPETLTLVANSLKAGFGLLQSLSLAAEQIDHPMGAELEQTIHEMNVGSSVDEALTNLNERSKNYDLDLVVTAILVQRSVGGNLAEILDTVAGTMRERVRIRGEVTTLTAQQRLTGIVIGLLPVGVAAMFFVVSPNYMTVLFTETMGKVMLGIAVLLEAVGIMIIRRILDIEV